MPKTECRKQVSLEALRTRGGQWLPQTLLPEDTQQGEAVLWDQEARGGGGLMQDRGWEQNEGTGTRGKQG